MAGLKVLMMGGQRVGKSSALAAIMNAFLTGAEKTFSQQKTQLYLQKLMVNGRLPLAQNCKK